MACLYWTNFIKNKEKKLLFWLLNILSMNMHTSFESAHLHTWYFSLHTRDLGEKGHTLQSGQTAEYTCAHSRSFLSNNFAHLSNHICTIYLTNNTNLSAHLDKFAPKLLSCTPEFLLNIAIQLNYVCIAWRRYQLCNFDAFSGFEIAAGDSLQF
jgi:hypothetical protein